MQGFEYQHNSSTYPLPSDMPPDIGPQNDPNVRDIDRAIDTRAAVSLLTRNIQIVSEGDDPSKTFSEMPSNYYYGGHTIVRQGFASFQVQGVEFAYLGQGGAIGRYPVHFHMARKTPQPKVTSTDPTPSPLNYLKDCSIHDSMTRFVTIHATQGMYISPAMWASSRSGTVTISKTRLRSTTTATPTSAFWRKPRFRTKFTIRARCPESWRTKPAAPTTCRTAPT